MAQKSNESISPVTFRKILTNFSLIILLSILYQEPFSIRLFNLNHNYYDVNFFLVLLFPGIEQFTMFNFSRF